MFVVNYPDQVQGAEEEGGEIMKITRKVSRRSFLTQVAGGAMAGTAAAVVLTGSARAAVQSDTDPTDAAGGGRTGGTDTDPTDRANRGSTGRSDSDPTDRGGRGATGRTDSDPTDRASRGRAPRRSSDSDPNDPA